MKFGIRLFLAAAAVLLGSAWLPGKVSPAQWGDPVLVGAGDLTQCGQKRPEATARLVESVGGTPFTLGDNAYPAGTLDQFNNCYEATWGRFKDRTIPVPGNHDYRTAGAEGYFTYFGPRASPLDLLCTKDCKGYYSFNLGAWHIIVLNSTIDMQAGSPQEQWLRADLALSPAACTLAMWHRPLFTAGRHKGDDDDTRPLWQALYEHGADLILNGHDHNYQRFAPQNPDGQADPRGIREIIAGTGGAELYALNKQADNLEVGNDQTYGVLKVTLHAESYDWEFIPVSGGTFTDFGAGTCVTDHSDARLIGTATPAPSPTPTPSPTPSPTPTLVSTETPVPTATPVPGRFPNIPTPGQGGSLLDRLIQWLKRSFGEA